MSIRCFHAQTVHGVGSRQGWRSSSSKRIAFKPYTERAGSEYRGGHHLPSTVCKVEEDGNSSGGPADVRTNVQQHEPPPRSVSPKTPASVLKELSRNSNKPRRQADSTDFIASSLTRRFGIAGGLAWLGILTFGVVSEQVKTRLEIAAEEANTKEVNEAREVVTPSGLRYVDLRIGGGSSPQRGDLLALDLKLSVAGEVVEDTKARGRPLALVFGSRSGAVCAGVEEALSSMRAGGKRRVTVPPELGFGSSGAVLRPRAPTSQQQGVVPPGSTLVYDLELLRVSIPPS